MICLMNYSRHKNQPIFKILNAGYVTAATFSLFSFFVFFFFFLKVCSGMTGCVTDNKYYDTFFTIHRPFFLCCFTWAIVASLWKFFYGFSFRTSINKKGSEYAYMYVTVFCFRWFWILLLLICVLSFSFDMQ